MKIITIANQKGGVGKTSILFHLASYLAREGKRCLVIDTDPQGDASFALRQSNAIETQTTADRLFTDAKQKKLFKEGQADGTGLFLCAASDALIKVEENQTLEEMAGTFQANMDCIAEYDAPEFDYTIIDTGPNPSKKMGAALFASDYILSPICLETFAMNGLAKMLDTIKTFQKFNKKLNFLGLVPNMVQKEYHKEMLAILQKEHSAITIPCPIGNRDSIREATTTGIPVWRIQRTAARKAAKEMLALGAYVLNKMENGGKGHGGKNHN